MMIWPSHDIGNIEMGKRILMKMNLKFFLEFLAGGISLINLLLPAKLY